VNVEPLDISVRELTSGYQDNDEDGVVGYGGKLDIRPPYQREFIYKDKQRDAVINTVINDYPLNVMYWAVRDIEGQQSSLWQEFGRAIRVLRPRLVLVENVPALLSRGPDRVLGDLATPASEGISK